MDISFKFCSPRDDVPSQLIGGVGKRVAGGGLLNFAPAYGRVPSSSESDEDQLALDCINTGELLSKLQSKGLYDGEGESLSRTVFDGLLRPSRLFLRL